MKAVTTPTGNSLGEITSLARVSAAIRNVAPPREATGMRRR